MKKTLFLLSLLLFTMSIYAQPANEAKNAFRSLINAFVKDDIPKTISYLHAKEIERQGGKENVFIILDTTRRFFVSIRSAYKSLSIDTLTKIYPVGTQLQCIIVGTLTTKEIAPIFMNYHIRLLGLSQDQGKNWTFVNIRRKKPEETRALIPDYHEELALFEKNNGGYWE